MKFNKGQLKFIEIKCNKCIAFNAVLILWKSNLRTKFEYENGAQNVVTMVTIETNLIFKHWIFMHIFREYFKCTQHMTSPYPRLKITLIEPRKTEMTAINQIPYIYSTTFRTIRFIHEQTSQNAIVQGQFLSRTSCALCFAEWTRIQYLHINQYLPFVAVMFNESLTQSHTLTNVLKILHSITLSFPNFPFYLRVLHLLNKHHIAIAVGPIFQPKQRPYEYRHAYQLVN